jgi:hypothetical protein
MVYELGNFVSKYGLESAEWDFLEWSRRGKSCREGIGCYVYVGIILKALRGATREVQVLTFDWMYHDGMRRLGAFINRERLSRRSRSRDIY